MASAQTYDELRDADGFVVESSAGDIGWVEEVWIGESGDPQALAVRTADGRHGLLLPTEVLAVDREQRWVVVPPEPGLLELDAPRVTGVGSARNEPLAASWTTTGATLAVTPRPRHLWHVPYRPSEPSRPTRATGVERPLWQGVAALLTVIALLVAVTITLAFVIADLLTGATP